MTTLCVQRSLQLANFPEIGAFVLVSCELTALIDGRDYLQPVLTPWEASVAFGPGGGKDWTGDVRLGFEHLLITPQRTRRDEGDTTASMTETEGGEPEDRDELELEPEFSLFTGSYRTRGLSHAAAAAAAAGGGDDIDIADANAGDVLAVRAERALDIRRVHGGAHLTTTAIVSGSDYLTTRREDVGLEPGPRRGDDGTTQEAPLEATHGRVGRARGYDTEGGVCDTQVELGST